MAPVPPQSSKPSARTLRHQRVTGQIHPLLPAKIHRPGTLSSDSFLSSKRDKRIIKSSSFLSRVRHSSTSRVSKASSKPASSATSKTVPGSAGLKSSLATKGAGNKIRRPKNKITSLDSLADALPELDEAEELAGGENLGKIRHKSLRSKKGALKKKEMVVKGEMERFGASLAKLTETSAQTGSSTTKDAAAMTTTPAASGENPTAQQPATSDRWAALRGYISTTMEQNPAFVKKS